MGRRAKDTISQARLVNELRVTIDRAMLATDPRSQGQLVRRIRHLLDANPRSAQAAHVLHNLGRGRRAWLSRAGLFQVDATQPSLRHGRFGSEVDAEVDRMVRSALVRARSTQGSRS